MRVYTFEKITKKTKAIMAVHIYGRLCDMKRIHKIAKKHNLKVIEDACEAQGAVFNSKADITCYSFYANKVIKSDVFFSLLKLLFDSYVFFVVVLTWAYMR